MFKKIFSIGFSTLLVGATLFSAPLFAQAEEEVQQQQQPQSRTLILTATGSLSGSISPYYDAAVIPGLETGFINLHYFSANSGFVDGDYSYLTVELPQEFATLMKQASFKENIVGHVRNKGLFGDKNYEYNQNDIVVNGTQISFKNPRELWIIQGEVEVDIEINYGRVQANYPIRIIADSKTGSYTFKSALRRSMAPWDPIQNPILGSNTKNWVSGYNSAYW
ncbi:conserved exported hypothetical protein [Carnobacterium maltaromaticum]|uniref:hypothetical protein n=1 Tax=Carnobacterium maltaromaticum TaxID=2751 RepID=UPI00191B9AEB|nr:hypothetical protein [Carnobacterium maltaromaticum]CAD5901428.1 conserved exported hypothetical protein [Carnobacterium maltaromaticum]